MFKGISTETKKKKLAYPLKKLHFYTNKGVYNIAKTSCYCLLQYFFFKILFIKNKCMNHEISWGTIKHSNSHYNNFSPIIIWLLMIFILEH